MRVILFTGKGGTGKTSMAAATALALARRGVKTIAVSTDSAHSLSDSFSLDPNLFDLSQGKIVKIEKNLDALQVNITYEIDRFWHEINQYIALLFATQGLDDVVAEELAIIPGMEELSALLYVNQFDKEGNYDVLIIDCAPTGETLRFLGMPDALEWYMNKIFNLERKMANLVRPIAHRVTNIPFPSDDVFENFKGFYEKIDGVKAILIDPEKTSVRIVTNPEKMVLRETRRSYTYFCLYDLLVDQIIVNKVFPENLKDKFFNKWHKLHKHYLKEIEEYFSPIPIVKVPLLEEEVLGIDFLVKLGEMVYGDSDPAEIFYDGRPIKMYGGDDELHLSVRLPFAEKEGVELFQSQEELVIRIGNFKRNIFLPRSFQKRKFKEARWDGDNLVIDFEARDSISSIEKQSDQKTAGKRKSKKHG
jgi:arsenite-transporting ATPase